MRLEITQLRLQIHNVHSLKGETERCMCACEEKRRACSDDPQERRDKVKVEYATECHRRL
jgi:hypothetical protein